jgi:hypothetical protein
MNDFLPKRGNSLYSFATFLRLKTPLRIPILLAMTLFCSFQAFADYSVPTEATVNATTLTGHSGVLTINGTVQLNSNVSLPNITSIIINGPSGNIIWQNNSDLVFAAGTIFIVTSNATGVGLLPITGSASQRLVIGGVIIAVANSSANNASFSFADSML